jgi:hypothetical protein
MTLPFVVLRRDPGTLAAAQLAVATAFFANGTGLASWVPHIPMVQTRLDLTPGILGVILLAMAAGALVAMPLAGWMIPRVGSRAVLRAAVIVFFAALPLPILAPTGPSLFAALLLLGASNGAVDVAMNAQAVAFERQLGRPIMSTFHGLWSVGGLAGAAICALALHAGIAPIVHVLAAAAGLGTFALAASPELLPRAADVASHGPRFARPTGRLLALGGLAALALFAEGSIADWSAVYLRTSLATGPAVAALGFAAFSLAMAGGRLAGDSLVRHFGAARLVRAASALGALGLGAGLTLGHPLAALLGCACVGFGLANTVPILFRAAGQMPGISPGHGIAAMTTAGYCGFLAGPPVIGLTAEVVTLPGALAMVAALLAVIAGAARLVDAPSA